MTRYDRLARESTTFAHWRLPLAAVLAGALFVVVIIELTIAAILALLIARVDLGGVEDRLLDESAFASDPLVFTVLMATIVAMTPAVLGGLAIAWPAHVPYLFSVEGRVRWGWLLRCLLAAAVVLGLTFAVALVVSQWSDHGSVGSLSFGPRAPMMILLVLLITPIQSATEELVFRGALLQLLGSWIRWPVVPVLLSTVAFTAGHGYELWGLVDVATFGLIAAVITLRTGGLEAAVALHAVNNVFLFLLDIAGLIDTSDTSDATAVDVVPTVVSGLVFWAIVEWQASRTGLVRRRPAQSVTVSR